MIVTITLMALVAIPLVAATFTTINASATARAASQVETALVNAADRVNRAPVVCDYTIYAQAAVQTQGWDPSQARVEHEYYVPAATPATPGVWVEGANGACEAAEPTSLLVQRMRIFVTSPDGDVTRSYEVVKSDV